MTGEEEEQLQVAFRGKRWLESQPSPPHHGMGVPDATKAWSEIHVGTKPSPSLSSPYRGLVSEHVAGFLQPSDAAVGGSVLSTQPLTGYRISSQTPSPCDSCQWVVVSLIPSSQMGKRGLEGPQPVPEGEIVGDGGWRGSWHTTILCCAFTLDLRRQPLQPHTRQIDRAPEVQPSPGLC